MAWNYRTYGSIDDPIHKSDLHSCTSQYGCLKRFRYDKDLVADGGSRDSDTECNGMMVAGTAVHECVARALGNPTVRAQLLNERKHVSVEHCRKVYDEELAQTVAGRQVNWYDNSESEIATDRAAMICGVLNDMHHHVRAVHAIEAGFIVRIGDYWCSGHVDLLYESRKFPPGTVALADWKTGQQRPHPIELDHSWESGIYSAAMRDGIWIAREHVELPMGTVNKYMRERAALEAELIRVAKLYEHGELPEHAYMLGKFPCDIRYVHLPDYPPYKRATKKEASRPEELEFFGLDVPGTVASKAGDRRGPAWYQVRRTEEDIPRLQSLLKNLVGTIRMGRFFESIGEKCSRCAHKEPCLNSGYEVRGVEREKLERVLREIEIVDDGLGDVA